MQNESLVLLQAIGKGTGIEAPEFGKVVDLIGPDVVISYGLT